MVSQFLWASLILFCVVYSFYKYKQIVIIQKYTSENILKLLEMFMDKSYETIYDTDLIHYILNSNKPNREEQETLERNYIKTCFLYMGKHNKRIFLDFFGDEETLIINIIRHMRKKYNEDGLTKIIDEQTKQNS
jgi:hypothetical protein